MVLDAAYARRLWHVIEPINAVTYFTAECRDAMKHLGMKGFWMGYFAARAAPMGAVDAGVVEATFFNFHPRRIAPALPDAWDIASPARVLEARAAAAAASLRRLYGGIEDVARDVLGDLRGAVARGESAGRPLYAANRGVTIEGDGVAALWQAGTTLREHRGDGHVAALTYEGLGGCEAHALFAASTGVPAKLLQESRGWSDEEWASANDALYRRGLIDESRRVTDGGRALRKSIERRTDELAIAPFESLGEGGVQNLIEALSSAARAVANSGELMFPNPMGLPQQS